MPVVSLGEAADRVVERTATMMALQALLRSCPTDLNRRRLINSAYANGALTDVEYRALAPTAGSR